MSPPAVRPAVEIADAEIPDAEPEPEPPPVHEVPPPRRPAPVPMALSRPQGLLFTSLRSNRKDQQEQQQQAGPDRAGGAPC